MSLATELAATRFGSTSGEMFKAKNPHDESKQGISYLACHRFWKDKACRKLKGIVGFLAWLGNLKSHNIKHVSQVWGCSMALLSLYVSHGRLIVN